MKLSVWQLKLQDGVSRGLSSISGMADKVSRKFTQTQTRISSFSARAKQDLADLTSQIPGLSGIGAAIANPMVMAGAAITAVAVGFATVTKKAADFEHQFLELRQLNLDKTNAELERLNDQVLRTSFNTGMLAKDTAKAYFDIQSATGKYGAEVDSIVEKTALFARATKTNFDSAIQSVGKAINAFGMDAKDMDKFFASSFKTVQVGITTFDQLAETQTDYAGAAAAANQSIDDANKLFAAFTQTAKSTREAGTLTKQTFNDLTRKSTIDGFKAIGVSMFDNAGAMKSLDAITRELVPKLQGMSDLEFSRFKEAVGGSEGIRALLDRTKASGDELIRTFDDFDKTEFNFAQAIENANGDLTTMSTLLSNKIDTVLVRIGKKTLPDVIIGIGTLVDWVDKIVTKWDDLNENSRAFQFIMGNIWSAITEPFRAIGTIVEQTLNFFDAMQRGWNATKTILGQLAEASLSLFEGIGHAMDRNFGMAALSLKNAKDELAAIGNLNRMGGLGPLVPDSPLAVDEPAAPFPFRVGGEAGAVGGGGGLAAGGGTVDPTDGINTIAGGGKSVRNVTVNIAKLVEAINIHTSQAQSELPNIEEMITRALVRAVGGAEISLSNG